MKNLGLGLATGIDSFAQGFEMGERIKSRKSDQEWAEEQKTRQRSEWQYTDEQRDKQDALGVLKGAMQARQAGIDFDQRAVVRAAEKLGKYGIQLPKYLSEADKMRQWVDVGTQALQTGVAPEGAKDLLNWRLREEVQKGVGDTLDRDMIFGNHIIPKGSRIVDKAISEVLPSKSRNGIYMGLDVTVETPDGKRLNYPAPVTVGRGAADDGQVLEIPYDKIEDMIEGDRFMLTGLNQDPEYAKWLQTALLAGGGELPEVKKPDEFKREIGNEIVTFQRMPDGTEKEVARAPRWQPEKPEKTPTETWNNPVEEVSPDGKRILVRYSNLGNRQVVEGATPKADKKTELTSKQAENARNKLQTVRILRKQIDNLKAAREGLGSMSQGIVAGRNPLSEAGSNYDAALAALQTTVRQLTRTPGEGAMSDYESRIAQSQLPNRADFPSSIDQKIAQLEDLANVVESGYSDLLGTEPAAAATSQPARTTPARPAQPVREGATATNPQTGERVIFRGGRWESL